MSNVVTEGNDVLRVDHESGRMNGRVSCKKVAIIGGGFAGIEAAKHLRGSDVHVTVIDRSSYHTFQPLLYQVALAVLSPSDITRPIRSILGAAANIDVLLGEVEKISRENQKVILKSGECLDYDYLVLASGSTSSYFGNDRWSLHAPALKSIVNAVEIRTRLLLEFEKAEAQGQRSESVPDIHFVVIGGGPTGVELAGAIADVCRNVLNRDFHYVRPREARISLYEGGPAILAAFPPKLQAEGLAQLKELGVAVHTGVHITDIHEGAVFVEGKEVASNVTLWAAGVAPSALGAALGVPLDKRGAVVVNEFLNPEGNPNVFVCGDLAAVTENGRRIPAVAQPAMQMGKHAARLIIADIKGKARTPFHYFDKGDMATIGTRKAVARVAWPFKAQWSGRLAWITWLVVHLSFLSGLDHQMSVLFTWLYTYITKTTRSRLIVIPERSPLDAE
jgi:NADH dehydrogenase